MKHLLLLGLLIVCLGLSACGKMSMPEPYPDSGYPHTYPRQ